jgi:hypothetical protein
MKYTISELQEAHEVARLQHISLREVRQDSRRDATIIEDRSTGDRRSIPNKTIKMFGVQVAYVLHAPEGE